MDKYQTTRTSESPARTIDSRDSTTESVETIVDRKNQQNNMISSSSSNTQKMLENQTTTMANSTNTTNNCNKNSLTNSQISMISNDQKDSHIYTSPDLVYLKSIKPITQDITNSPDKFLSSDTKIIKSSMMATKADGGGVGIPLKVTGIHKHHHSLSDGENYDIKATTIQKKQSFPIHIILGLIQLILSVALAALGGLLIVRGASLASSASGLWAGGICAIAGALGVINLRKAQTGFLAVSLICVASSTLAMALTGIGLVRDINRLETAEFNTQSTKAAISAGGGLVFVLVLHFIVSIISVYQSALRLCSRYNTTSSQILDNVVTAHNATILSQQKVEEYIKSMSAIAASRGEKPLSPEECEKLKTMWLYSVKRGGMKTVIPPLHRPVMLVPAAAGNGLPPHMPPGFRAPPPPPPSSLIPSIPPILYPPGIYPHGCVMIPPNTYHPYAASLSLAGSLPPGSVLHHPESIYKMHSIHRTSGSEISKRHLKRRTGKQDANRRQRRKSDSDIENRKAFTYTGLDRAIADSFLERQELSNNGNGSHFDYSSTTSSESETIRDRCPDVAI